MIGQPTPDRTPRRRTLTAGVLAMLLTLAAALLTAAPAQAVARSWSTYFTYGHTCSNYHQAGNLRYALCTQRSSTGQARTVAYVSPAGSGKISVTVSSWSSRWSNSWTCATVSLGAGQNRTCYGDWYTPASYHGGYATFVVNGVRQSQLGNVVNYKPQGRKQETNTYCGPAAMQSALLTMGSPLVAQSTLAAESGTGSIGTMPWNVPNAMNRHVAYSQYDDNNFGQRSDAINRVGVTIRLGRPGILLVNPNRLPGGTGDYFGPRHYVTVFGYATSGSTIERVAYFDPGSAAMGLMTVSQFGYAAYGANPLHPFSYTFVSA